MEAVEGLVIMGGGSRGIHELKPLSLQNSYNLREWNPDSFIQETDLEHDFSVIKTSCWSNGIDYAFTSVGRFFLP